MNIGNIIKGNANAFFGLNKDISEERIKICKKCPLFTKRLGLYICNPNLYINIETGDVSSTKKDGYKHGCGCIIKSKTSVLDEKCPLSKW